MVISTDLIMLQTEVLDITPSLLPEADTNMVT